MKINIVLNNLFCLYLSSQGPINYKYFVYIFEETWVEFLGQNIEKLGISILDHRK